MEKKLIIEEKKIKKLINALTKIYEEHLLSERKLNIQLIEDNIIIELNEQHKIKIHPKEKLTEAQKAIADGADELDFVINFKAFKKGEIEKVGEDADRHSYIL